MNDQPLLSPAQQEEWERIQRDLAGCVLVCPSGEGYTPETGDVVWAFDIQYEGDRAYVAVDVSRWQGDVIGTYVGAMDVLIPYVSGFFCFREGPPLLALIETAHERSIPPPALCIVDGHGLAHPRRFGAACWLGVATGVPTLGCAKDTLLRYEGELSEEKGSTLPVFCEEERVGSVLRRIQGVRPVYVSVGHELSLEGAEHIVFSLPSSFRVPDPIRRADQAARARSRGEEPTGWVDFGELPPVKLPF